MLRLPSIRSCLELRDKFGKLINAFRYRQRFYFSFYLFLFKDHSFEFIVEGQPIGHKLFLMYCEKDLQLSRCMQFLHAVDEMKIVVEGKRLTHAQTVFDDFVSTEVSQNVMAGKVWCMHV